MKCILTGLAVFVTSTVVWGQFRVSEYGGPISNNVCTMVSHSGKALSLYEGRTQEFPVLRTNPTEQPDAYQWDYSDHPHLVEKKFLLTSSAWLVSERFICDPKDGDHCPAIPFTVEPGMYRLWTVEVVYLDPTLDEEPVFGLSTIDTPQVACFHDIGFNR